ncbi:hypothetical protein [Bradyrhizobium zhanjiangense]|uniref:hypothetical protein n=1 Tax=Bradyrhizobium zhanjiangense TaxID=1325107 RepID=UPI001008DB54|nr:hypothetical protein [Bradyrhizobium zhanjiangense]
MGRVVPKTGISQRFNPKDAIAVLTGGRREHFGKERETALVGFIAWMCYPNNPKVIAAAQAIGAANYLLNSKGDTRLPRSNPHFSQATFASTLIDYPLDASFKELDLEFDDLQNITEIVNFFMSCPDEQKPSLLKAIYFIDEGGFVPSDVRPEERRKYKRSAATLKNSWRKLAVAAPFIWAASLDDFKIIFDLSPASPTMVKASSKLLSHRSALLDFFGNAKFCQEQLLSRFSPRTFQFITFPSSVQSQPVQSEALDKAGIELIRTYRAPKWS